MPCQSRPLLVVLLLFLIIVVHAVLTGQYRRTLLVISFTSIFLALTETFVLQLVRDRVDEHIGSLLFLYLDKDHLLRRIAPKRRQGRMG